MRLDHYFQDELHRLRHQGGELAAAFPGLCRYLGHAGADPDVERLLEGAAFLTATLRARIDDQFPELSQGLLQLVAPQLLRIMPSLTLLQFQPIAHACHHPVWLAAGCEIDSEPIAGRSCRFRTCRAGWIYPARNHVAVTPDRTRLSLTVQLFTPLPSEQLALERLTLHLGGELAGASDLYLWMRQRLQSMTLEYGTQQLSLSSACLQPLGFAPDEALLPSATHGFPGHSLLQQYFAWANSLLFFELASLPSLPAEPEIQQFQLHFNFQQPLPLGLSLNDQSLLLNCFPAANLFALDAEPIYRHGRHHEYPLRCRQQDPEAYDLFAIDRVESWRRQPDATDEALSQPRRVSYRPFSPFRHAEVEPHGQYHLHSRQRPNGKGVQHTLSFVDDPALPIPSDGESISISLTCCDRDRPAQLPPGAIHLPTGNSPTHSNCRNLTRPTAARYPRLDEHQHWQLLNHLGHHFQTLLDKERLQTLLACYQSDADPETKHQQERRLAAIQSLTTTACQRLFSGLPIRGVHSQLLMDPQPFGSEGELYLFGSVLAHFLAQYVSINAFHQLEIINQQTGEHFLWPAMSGGQSLL